MKRRGGAEILDSDGVAADVRQASMRDVVRSNRWLGGRRAALRELDDVLSAIAAPGDTVTLLDIGTGLADIPERVAARWKARGVRVVSIGLDSRHHLLREALRGQRLAHAVCASAGSLPLAARSVDIVLCSQVLHHFAGAELDALLREANRVARRAVVIADLRRSPIAASGFWVASWLLGFHPVTRHDGVLSVLKGFTAGELRERVQATAAAPAVVRRRLGFRLTGHWTSRAADQRDRYCLNDMPDAMRMTTIDERVVRAPLERIFALASEVERWPEHLAHYRGVRFHERTADGGGVVEMSANRPFGVAQWPTWWTSQMLIRGPGGEGTAPVVRYRHIRGVTTGMEVEWSFLPVAEGTRVRIIHRWNGPPVPVIGEMVARAIIGPVFVHGIASRTLAGLAHVAERT